MLDDGGCLNALLPADFIPVSFLCYRVVWNLGLFCTSVTLFLLCYKVVWDPGCLFYRVEPCVVVSPYGLLLCVTWFRSEMYARLRSGRDAKLA